MACNCSSDTVHLLVSLLTFIFVFLTSLFGDIGLVFDRCPDCVIDCPVVDCYCYTNSSYHVF